MDGSGTSPVSTDETSEQVPEEDASPRRLEFADEVTIDASKQALWETISDPAVLTECVPGAQSIERVSEQKYTVDLERGVSHLTLSLSGEAELVEMNPPDYIVTKATAFESKTGTTFDILAAMEITDDPEGESELAYTAEVEYSGGAASLSTSLLRPVVDRDVKTYFDNVRSTVEGA
ncbi:MAG: CoxG family protein [Halanaeroarchaeum sp.]